MTNTDYTSRSQRPQRRQEFDPSAEDTMAFVGIVICLMVIFGLAVMFGR